MTDEEKVAHVSFRATRTSAAFPLLPLDDDDDDDDDDDCASGTAGPYLQGTDITALEAITSFTFALLYSPCAVPTTHNAQRYTLCGCCDHVKSKKMLIKTVKSAATSSLLRPF